MKQYKLLTILIIILLLVGCSKKEDIKPTKKVKENKTIIKKNTYEDLNKTPIGIYQDNNILNIVTEYNTSFIRGTDIAVFQTFPATEKNIKYNNKFAISFYEKWKALNPDNKIKIGFNIKYKVKNNTSISHNIFKPTDTMKYGNYLEIYLYDDYAHRNDSWYSHIEDKEYNDNTLYTSIKLTPGRDIDDIISSITLTVFTYDTPDDFINQEYRGNSKYSIQINRNN